MTGSRSRWLSARSLGLGVVALVLMTAMVLLGLWQLGVYDDHQRDDVAALLERTPVPLDDVLGPDDAFPDDGVSRPVTLTGRYLAAAQFEVVGSPRLEADRVVVTPFELPSGSAILVVRGTGASSTPPPSGPVELTGVLEPPDPTGGPVGADRVTDGLRIAALVQDFEQDLYSGYVVLRSSHPADALTPVDPPLPDASRWAGIRNLVYAVQWWLFAAFVGFMWWRIVTESTDSDDRPRRESNADDSAARSPGPVG